MAICDTGGVIEVDEVAVVTGGVTLLRPVSVFVSAGEALVVRGRNGTGKSTLLRVLAGIRRPSTGEVRISGAPVAERDRTFRRRVAAMIGLPPLAPDLTVADHARLVAATWFDDPTHAEHVARENIARLGLQTLGERFPHELSSGQTQLFGLALALSRPFEVLILDEPEQRLDTEHVEALLDTLHRLRERGVTMVVATHSPRISENLADRTLALDAA